MAKIHEAAFTRQSALSSIQVTVANTALDGTGTLVTLVTGGDDDTRVTAVEYKATVATTQGKIRYFLNDTVNIRLILERDVQPITPSATIESAKDFFSFSEPIQLRPGWSIDVGTEQAEAINVFAHAEDF